MASWTPSWSDDADRDAVFHWSDGSNLSRDSDREFADFLDFSNVSPYELSHHSINGHGLDHPVHQQNLHPIMSALDKTSFADPHANGGGSTTSSGFSTGDELDFLTASSHTGPLNVNSHANAGQEIDPRSLIIKDEPERQPSLPLYSIPQASLSEIDLPNVNGMTLYPPHKGSAHTPKTVLPGPPTQIESRGRRKVVDALSATVKKAASLRKGRKQQQQTDTSPMPDQAVQCIEQRRNASSKNKPSADVRAVSRVNSPSPPSEDTQGQDFFIQNHLNDPFVDTSSHTKATYLGYYGQHGFPYPLESPATRSGSWSYPNDTGAANISEAWPLPTASNSAHTSQWNDPNLHLMDTSGQQQQQQQEREEQEDENAWWGGIETSMMPHDQADGARQQQLAYKHSTPIMREGIHMPQPSRRASLQVIAQAQHQQMPHNSHMNALALTEQFHLPPPPPIPESLSSSDRTHRHAPKARSSGARHLSRSPVRNPNGNPRVPSASPTRKNSSSNLNNSHLHGRRSSNGSTTSLRSSSGRGPASMPGTPCSVRKRRSSGAFASLANSMNTPSRSSLSKSRKASVASLGGGGDDAADGFVNFTASDGASLMTGVAPSGSSKTKARREKEALEKRKKLSEAAEKAIAAAGGDVNKLREEGFEF